MAVKDKVKDLDKKSSDDLIALSAELTAGKGTMTVDEYRKLQKGVDKELEKRLKEDQKARRDADPDAYDAKHQGVGKQS